MFNHQRWVVTLKFGHVSIVFFRDTQTWAGILINIPCIPRIFRAIPSYYLKHPCLVVQWWHFRQKPRLPFEQWAKPLLVDDYRGLCYPIYWGF
jgi:hypothetical protein